MTQSRIGRRRLLSTGALSAAAGIATLAALSGCSSETRPAESAGEAPGAGSDKGVMSRERYQQYVDLFNANDPRFIEFYHPEVVLELGNATIEGAAAIRDFYAEVKAHIKETVTVNHFVADGSGVAVEIPTEFRVHTDWPLPNYFRRPLVAGDVYRVISFGLYWMEDGKFRLIKAARYKLVNDWQQEPEPGAA